MPHKNVQINQLKKKNYLFVCMAKNKNKIIKINYTMN